VLGKKSQGSKELIIISGNTPLTMKTDGIEKTGFKGENQKDAVSAGGNKTKQISKLGTIKGLYLWRKREP